METNHTIKKNNSKLFLNTWSLIIFFALIKLAFHLISINNFELHRDAYLYYAQSKHLAWGYFSAGPFTAVLGKLSTFMFGNTTFALRFFPALFGSLNIFLIGLTIRELKGGRAAIILGGSAYLLSPAYIHSNFLFQPVTFNHFFWILSCYFFVKLILERNTKNWIWIALVFGIGFLTKYSIVFLYGSFIIALIISKHRMLIYSKHVLFAILIGLIIIFPNILWQHSNNWPIISHMQELHRNQLVHVKFSDFIMDQILMNAHAILIWASGIVLVLFLRKEKDFRLFAYMFLLIIFLIAIGSGKSYYTLGVYPIMFVFGAYTLDKYVKRFKTVVFGAMIGFMFFGLYVSLDFDGVPFLSFEKILKKEAFRWEDGSCHDLPQDVADMTGWKEIGEAVSKVYRDNKEISSMNCDVFCYHYGQAGAVMFYDKDMFLPQPISFNDNFVFWSPDSLSKEYLIWVHSDLNNDFNPDSVLPARFDNVELKHTVDNKYFRENGTRIFLCKNPSDDYREYYKDLIKELKNQYR